MPKILNAQARVVPIVVTITVARIILDFLARLLQPFAARLGEIPFIRRLDESGINLIPGANLILTVLIAGLVLYLAGFISTTIVVRRVYDAGERMLMRIPLLKDIYGLSKQVIEMAASEKKPAFKHIALFEFPHPGRYAMGFITGESRVGEDSKCYVNVLMPFAPIPTQMFLILIPAEQVQVVDIPIESAVKFLMSGGAVSPGAFPLRQFSSMAELEGPAAEAQSP
ncbi:DUF502 domain-containing protein [Candidatus Sumerlaeota bacterium]|nr:DUF502 domain-containing protein [Candidatus Sumerlaeota bacterium]